MRCVSMRPVVEAHAGRKSAGLSNMLITGSQHNRHRYLRTSLSIQTIKVTLLPCRFGNIIKAKKYRIA